MKKIAEILFWSVIAAAFIGPGTVTTCARAGVEYRYALLWAIAFSTITCLVLQEASARVASVSGRDLGQALRVRFRSGVGGALVLLLVLGAIVVGCAAYQAGNLLGAAAGVSLRFPGAGTAATLATGAAAAALLWFARTTTIARLMGFVVALMGLCFVVTALRVDTPLAPVVRGSLVPTIPEGAGLLVVGLIGTTVVPYNLFLGSGLARGRDLREIRFGLTVAVLLGGLISAAVLLVGGAVAEPFSFEGLAAALSGQLGGWARGAFALGLLCAGFTSAITAPLAAAITARGLFEVPGRAQWSDGSWRYRAVWGAVMVSGVSFSITAVQPVQVIVLAQALNGVLLPFVAVFLLMVVNDRALMGDRGLNGRFSNLVMGLVVAVTLLLGISNVFKAVSRMIAG